MTKRATKDTMKHLKPERDLAEEAKRMEQLARITAGLHEARIP
jgi:hypothetical protein